jgi:LmbE family N-acetylglucosaminyl deacetylase
MDQATPPELVTVPAAGAVLVLAPHPDDEVAGCGGTLHLHSRQGARVTVVYMTDGRLGSLQLQGNVLVGAERLAFQEKLIRTRKAEAEAAGRVLGTGESIFLDFPDGDLRLSRETVRCLEDLLAARRPEAIYVPFPADRHRDHVETARILGAATTRTVDGCQVYAYEVWNPLYPNCMVDISEVIEIKRQALLQFSSQIQDNDFPRSILGLNAYRSGFHLGSRGYAETFFRCSPRQFRWLCGHVAGMFS